MPLRWPSGVVVVAALAWCGPATASRSPYPIRRLMLPEPRVASGAPGIDAVAGEAPGANHRRGTVLVVEAGADEPSPAVTEWDLATGAIERSASLPLSADFVDVQIVRARDVVHLVATDRSGTVVHLRLTRALDVERVERLGTGERARIASGGDLVAVLWSGRQESEGSLGWQLVTFSSKGERLAAVQLASTSASTFLYGEPLVVADGEVFVLMPDGGTAMVAQLTAGGRIQRMLSLSESPDDGRLFVSRGAVYFTDDCTAGEIWPPPARSAPRVALPGRTSGTRGCASFDAVAEASGRLVTTRGEIVSARWSLERRLAAGDAIGLRALWVGRQPALLVAENGGDRASLVWEDAGVP